MKISISHDLTTKLPEFNVVAYTMSVDNNKTEDVNKLLNDLTLSYTIEEVLSIPRILQARNGYKKLGKDPSHTRPACEALVRRVLKQQGIYSLGDLIDLGNILSVLTQRSVCVVDADKIQGDVLIRVGLEREHVDAINRQPINAYNLPVYTDDLGIFGSPTSDTLRTAVSCETKNILVMIICFEQDDVEKDEQLLLELYKKYANAKEILKLK